MIELCGIVFLIESYADYGFTFSFSILPFTLPSFTFSLFRFRFLHLGSKWMNMTITPSTKKTNYRASILGIDQRSVWDSFRRCDGVCCDFFLLFVLFSLQFPNIRVLYACVCGLPGSSFTFYLSILSSTFAKNLVENIIP